MSECNHDCGSCGQDCASRKAEDLRAKPNELSSVKKVIAVVSGKGGVGKSLVTSLLAVTMQRRGKSAAVLDADITGPSIPKAFGIHEKATGLDIGIFPVKSKFGTQLMSINLLLEDDESPVLWRGPLIAGAVKQFWTDVIWKDVDFMFVDMPPGTGDVPLTVFQSLPIDGIIVVTSPQELVSMIVNKAVNMAKMMNVPVLGVVENMSYAICPDCKKHIRVFGESHTADISAKFGLPLLAEIPIDPGLTRAVDAGSVELFEGDWLEGAADAVEALK